MWSDRVSNPGPLTYESGALPTALCGPAQSLRTTKNKLSGWWTPVSVSELGCHVNKQRLHTLIRAFPRE